MYQFKVIIFESDYMVSFFSVKTCGGVLSDNKGVITSPLHPSFYPPALDCKWTIKVCGTFTLRTAILLSTSSIHSLPRIEGWGSNMEAKLFSTSSVFICQTAAVAEALTALCCFLSLQECIECYLRLFIHYTNRCILMSSIDIWMASKVCHETITSAFAL